MVKAMVVLLIPVLLAWAWFSRIPDGPTITPVEWQAVATKARAESPYPILTPENLPNTWVATRVHWYKVGKPGLDGQAVPGNTWQLGFLSPEKIFIALDQRDAETTSLIKQVTKGGTSDGTVTIAGRTWTRYDSPDGHTKSLVLTEPPVVSAVSGDTSYEGLVAFASTLR